MAATTSTLTIPSKTTRTTSFRIKSIEIYFGGGGTPWPPLFGIKDIWLNPLEQSRRVSIYFNVLFQRFRRVSGACTAFCSC